MRQHTLLLATAIIALTWPTQPLSAENATHPAERGSQAGEHSKAYGVNDLSILSISARSAAPVELSSDTGWHTGSLGYRDTNPSPVNKHLAPVRLPTGALIQTIELEACDNDPGGAVYGYLEACGPTASDGCSRVRDLDGVVSTEDALGCDRFTVDYSPPYTVDNLSFSYDFAFVDDPVSTTGLGFRSARIYWRRQISPAPGSATFNDVPPSHPFFQPVEAMADAGISGGCGGGDFCPNSVVTRGQMAAFLARALGLHWPN